MSHIAADLFEYAGKDYLVAVDRFSNWAFCERLNKTTTANVTKILLGWFRQFGLPKYIRTDGGPQFRTEFMDFCDDYHIIHELSSAYNPKSNGLAESAVKSVKSLVRKCKRGNEDFLTALLARQNVPGSNGISPAMAFLGRPVRANLPEVSPKDQINVSLQDTEDPRAQLARKQMNFGEIRKTRDLLYETNLKRKSADKKFSLAPLSIGDKVRVQDPNSKLWDTLATVTEIRDDGRSYRIISEDGKLYLRNRRYLKPFFASSPADEEGEFEAIDVVSEKTDEESGKIFSVRRSKRIAERADKDIIKKVSFSV